MDANLDRENRISKPHYRATQMMEKNFMIQYKCENNEESWKNATFNSTTSDIKISHA